MVRQRGLLVTGRNICEDSLTDANITATTAIMNLRILDYLYHVELEKSHNM